MKLSFFILHSAIVLGICSGILFFNLNIATAEQVIPIDTVSLILLNSKDLQGGYIASSHSQSIISDEVLGQLQELLLKTVLLEQKLPGFDELVRFPDLSFLLQASPVILVDENLANSISFLEISIPVCILSQETLLEEVARRGNVPYLHFQPAEVEGSKVRLTLESRIRSDDPNQYVLGLSVIQVTFQKISDIWQVVDEPILFSN